MLNKFKKLYNSAYAACLTIAPYIIPVLVLWADFPPASGGKG